MPQLPQSAAAWGTPDFAATLQQELAALPLDALNPIPERGNHLLPGSVQAMLLTVQSEEGRLHLRVGLFFRSQLLGCSCADDPTPVPEENEYGELALWLELESGEAMILPDWFPIELQERPKLE